VAPGIPEASAIPESHRGEYVTQPERVFDTIAILRYRLLVQDHEADMTTTCSTPGLLMTAAFMVGSSVVAQSRPLPGADAFPPLRGPYAVGVREFFWADPSRPEPFTKDPTDHRRLVVRVWYPVDRTGGAAPIPWSERALYIRDLEEFGGRERLVALPYSLVRPFGMRVRSHSVADAPLATREPRFPVLVFQPGGGQARFTATFLTEQLASHGYVVVSADHPGLSPMVVFPDGSRFQPDTLNVPPPPTGNQRDDALAYESYLDRDVFPTWTTDASLVLDKLEELDRTPGQPFFERLDLTRIGMLGWSFGGATSLQMSKDDPRVKAAMNYDGTLFGDVRETGTHRPVMLMDNGAEGGYDAFLDRSTADWYEVSIANTNHSHFSDLPLFSTPQPRDDVDRVHEIINAYTLAFFDRYLLGRDSELLAGPSAAHPEVTFRRK
jgi:dienelactone hydrolase